MHRRRRLLTASPSTSRPPPTAELAARLVTSSTQPAATVLLAAHVAGHLLEDDGKAVRASEAAAFQSALGEAAIRSIGGMQP